MWTHNVCKHAMLQDDTQETVKSRQTKLKSGTLKRKTAIKINDIKEYREQKTSLDVALLNVIDEKDRIAYPEERVGLNNHIPMSTVIPEVHNRYIIHVHGCFTLFLPSACLPSLPTILTYYALLVTHSIIYCPINCIACKLKWFGYDYVHSSSRLLLM